MKYALAWMIWLFPAHHAPPPPPVVVVPATTTTVATRFAVPAPPSIPQETTTTTTQPPPQPATLPAVSSAPPSWQVAWIVRCPPSPGVWYTYSGNLAQAQEIYNQQVALVGQPASPGCFYGSVSEPEQVTG